MMKTKYCVFLILAVSFTSCSDRKDQNLKQSNPPAIMKDTNSNDDGSKSEKQLIARPMTTKILKFCGLKPTVKLNSERQLAGTFGDFSKLEVNLKSSAYSGDDTVIDFYSLNNITRISIIEFNDTADRMKIELLCFDKKGQLIRSQTTIGEIGLNSRLPDSYSSLTSTIDYKSGKPTNVDLQVEDKHQTKFNKMNPPKPTFFDSKLLTVTDEI